jgi:peptidoglycan/xylan/chitin deacetylase (PgdA/CDA1 family)/tetratricopeptide (TPR) repeat protein
MKDKKYVIPAILLAVAAAVALFLVRPHLPAGFRSDPALQASLDGITQDFRKIIVLVDGAGTLDEATHARAIAAGQMIFWRKHHALEDVTASLSAQYRDAAHARFRTGADGVRQLLQYLGANPQLHDADKLAFLDLVEELDAVVPPSASNRNALVNSVRALGDNLRSIQMTYREEVTRIFSQFATRGGAASREKWDAYVASLRQQMTREQILAEFPDTTSEYTGLRGAPAKDGNEIFGTDFAPKSVALTFDDGPHPRYTEQVLALLRKYGIRACFFELGVNLGTVDAAGNATLSRTGEISKKVLEAGNVIANHTFSHRVLPKLSEAERTSEIDRTDLLLQKVAGQKPVLFRAPYGARNSEILKEVNADGLRSVMWTIDSLDWADPVPESIAMRVLHELQQKQKGIILFHDIHKQSVLALSPVIEELQRQDYNFLAFDNGKFVKSAPPISAERAPAAPVQTATAASSTGPAGPSKFYRESWAVIVGINDYESWPKLRYAVNDANGIEEILVAKYGFKHENIRKLIDRKATRQNILEILGDEFTDGKKVQREDRVFFFFAGHGATRTMDDGRQLGFIVPVDADKTNYYSTAISMTTLREASDLIPAKHIYFVMDSCYSGLALTRGTGTFSRDRTYLEEVTRRSARQILTAGGAEQQVADDGPNGHSVFTWALLEGLQGKADLDGNGVITASELGAYISPIVSQFARQTPTVGNFVGSEGGEFIFELPQPESLSASTQQLDGQSLKLTAQLSTLEKEIASKQAELLKLQQSILSEGARLAQVTRAAAPKTSQAYALDREGQQLYREKKYDQAIRKFQAAIALKPNDPILLNNLGFVYYVMGRYDDALSYLQKTLAADPKRKEAHGNLADVYLKLGRRDDAKKEYEQYLALYPASPRAPEVKRVLSTL